MGGADEKGPGTDAWNTPRDIEARAALNQNLARQREIAEGKRVVNTQGRDSIALADEKNKPELDDQDQPGWLP